MGGGVGGIGGSGSVSGSCGGGGGGGGGKASEREEGAAMLLASLLTLRGTIRGVGLAQHIETLRVILVSGDDFAARRLCAGREAYLCSRQAACGPCCSHTSWHDAPA